MKPVHCGKGRRHLRNIFVFNFALREIVLSVAYKTNKYVKRVCVHCTIVVFDVHRPINHNFKGLYWMKVISLIEIQNL